MNNIIFTLNFILLTIIVGKINCGVIIMGNGITTSDKFNIYTKNDILYCGILTCPAGSRCIITQKNNPNNAAELVTREKCFDNDDNLIKQSELIEPGDPNNLINTRIESGAGGSYIYNPELQSQIEETVHKSVTQTLQNVHDNLNNILGKTLSNGPNFGNSFPFGPRNSPFGVGFPFNNENRRNVGGQQLDSRLGYEVTGPAKPNYRQNTREDIDSYEDINLARK